jgi:N-acyl-D-aspartate/D-glutamate deacylase
MAYDILIKNGNVVDGSGLPAIRGDVAIKDGKIVARGRINAPADTVIDADGLTVSPGFIDIHTHYDPHWWWNPMGTPSSWHGVTTVVTGNCGLTLAPCRPENRQAVAGIFSQVEEVSMATLDAVLPWDWQTFGEYMDRLDNRTGINLMPLLGHSAIRVHTMGEAAGERAATADEITAMQHEVRQAMEAGAWGWTTSVSPTHVGPTGAPVPSRYADDNELFAFAEVMAEYHTGAMEIIPPNAVFGITAEDRELLRQLALRSGRPVLWLGHGWKWFKPDLWREEQAWMAGLAKEGATVLANLTLQPFDRVVNYKRTSFFNGLETWRDIMSLPLEERKARFADPSVRPALRHAIDNPQTTSTKGQIRPPIRWEAVTVLETHLEKNKWMEGKRVLELAKQQGVHVADLMTDLALEEDFATDFRTITVLAEDEAVQGELLNSPFVILGSSDSGAHINNECKSGEPTYCVRHWVHEQQTMSLEEAVRRWTWVPANVFGLRDRGLISEGMKADVIVYSPDQLKIGKKEMIQDVPSGETRLIQKAEGMHHTIVNGRVLLNGNQETGDLPGEVLRSSAYTAPQTS